jgi:hypothetical protein
LGELEESAESRTLDTTFEQANVGWIKAALEGEFFLGQAAFGTNFPERLPKRPLRAGLGMDVAAALLC